MKIADLPKFAFDVALFHALLKSAERLCGRVAGFEGSAHGVARHGVPSAVRQRLGAIAHQLAAVEKIFDERMCLPLLKCRMRIKLWISVFKGQDKADGTPVVRKAVDPAAAVQVG